MTKLQRANLCYFKEMKNSFLKKYRNHIRVANSYLRKYELECKKIDKLINKKEKK